MKSNKITHNHNTKEKKRIGTNPFLECQIIEKERRTMLEVFVLCKIDIEP